MNSHLPTIDLDPAVHGALLRLLKPEPETRPVPPEKDLPEQHRRPAEYRKEAKELLASDPTKARIPEFCKAGSCDSHHFGWCRAVPGKAFYNIKFLEVCPLKNSG